MKSLFLLKLRSPLASLASGEDANPLMVLMKKKTDKNLAYFLTPQHFWLICRLYGATFVIIYMHFINIWFPTYCLTFFYVLMQGLFSILLQVYIVFLI